MIKKINYNYIFLFYDIKEKRVNKVFKKCKKYLNHWQNSVFRGEITQANIIKLEKELQDIINPDEDFISIIKIVNMNVIGEKIIGTNNKNTMDLFI